MPITDEQITLGLDTAGASTSVALWRGEAQSGALLGFAEQAMARGHAEALLPMVRDLVADALGSDATGDNGFGAIDKVAGLTGPGSFTGIRICVAAARGLGLAMGCPVVGVTAFEAVAHQIEARDGKGGFPVAIAFDAKRGQVYLQCFAASGLPLAPASVVNLADAHRAVPPSISVICGSGAHLVADASSMKARDLTVKPAPNHDAGIVARLGSNAENAEPPLPLYLRRPDAKPQLNRLERVPPKPPGTDIPSSLTD